jgi:hypothetical protein
MATITIDGMPGALSPSGNEVVELALSLIAAGYSVKINGLRVRVSFGPGYDTLTWAEGSYTDSPVEINDGSSTY